MQLSRITSSAASPLFRAPQASAPFEEADERERRRVVAAMRVRRQLSKDQVPAFSRFIAQVSSNHPRMLPTALRLAALGYHFERITVVSRS